MSITRKGRWVVTRRDNGQFVSQHDTVDNAIESAYARTFPTNIAPPRYEVVPPETGTATPASAVYWLIDKDPATQEAPQDFDLMPSFNVRAPIRGKVSAVVGATGQANPQLAVPSWSGPPTYNIDQGTIYTNQTIPVYANGKPITVAWVSGIVGGQTVGPPGPNWITFSTASATPTVTFSGHVDADDVTNMVWSATVGNGTPVINPTAGQITVRQSAPVWVGVPTATAIVGQTVDTNVTQVTVVNNAPVTLAWVSGRINGLPVSQPSWLSFVAGYPPIIRCTNPPNENQDITDMVLTATANGQSQNSSAGSITVTSAEPSWLTVPTVTFTQGTGGTLDLKTGNVLNYDDVLHDVQLYSGSLPAGVTMDSEGVLTYNGTAGASSSSVRVEIVNSAETDWTARISDPNVVWYHDFRTNAEVNAFRWTNGFGSGNDPNSLGTNASLCRWIDTDGITGGCLELYHDTNNAGDQSYWWRPLSPFNTGSGKSVNDPAANGTMAVQPWSPTSGGSQTVNWNSGWYGHPNSTPSVTKDGHDFYLQLRVKMDPNRMAGNGTSLTVGKFIWLTTCKYSLSNAEHVVWSYGNGGNQGAGENYFRVYATNVVGQGYYDPLNPSGDIQPGDETGNVDWYWSGGWDTVLIHLRPGQPGVTSGSNASLFEVWAANQGETSYKKIWTQTYGIIGYESGGGLQALILAAYNNNRSFTVPFYHRYAQVIFSKSWIPCPQA